MKNYSPEYAAHILLPFTTIAICWKVTKKNGDEIFGTSHDRDIEITSTNIGMDFDSTFSLNGLYRANSGIIGSDIRSASDMSVDNMEVNGGFDPVLQIGIDERDILSGLLDSAKVTTFKVNWQDPDNFQDVMRHGDLGNIDWTSDKQYRSEVRGLNQVLQQTIGRSCGDRCDVARFGDSRCKFNISSAQATGVVTSVTNNKRFNSTLTQGSFVIASPHFRGGTMQFTTGSNAGSYGQVKLDNVGGTLGNFEMQEEFYEDVEVGDEFTLLPGCDRTYATCKDVFENLLNFRGPGYFCPGPDAIIRAP